MKKSSILIIATFVLSILSVINA